MNIVYFYRIYRFHHIMHNCDNGWIKRWRKGEWKCLWDKTKNKSELWMYFEKTCGEIMQFLII